MSDNDKSVPPDPGNGLRMCDRRVLDPISSDASDLIDRREHEEQSSSGHRVNGYRPSRRPRLLNVGNYVVDVWKVMIAHDDLARARRQPVGFGGEQRDPLS